MEDIFLSDIKLGHPLASTIESIQVFLNAKYLFLKSLMYMHAVLF